MLTRRNKVEQEDSIDSQVLYLNAENIQQQHHKENPTKPLDGVQRIESSNDGNRQQRVGGAYNKEFATTPLNGSTTATTTTTQQRQQQQQQNNQRHQEREQRPIYSISRMTQMARVSTGGNCSFFLQINVALLFLDL